MAVASGVSACDTTRSKIFRVNCAPGQIAVGGGYPFEPCDGSGLFVENFAAAADEPAGDVGSAPGGWYVAIWDGQAKINGQAESSTPWRAASRASCVAS